MKGVRTVDDLVDQFAELQRNRSLKYITEKSDIAQMVKYLEFYVPMIHGLSLSGTNHTLVRHVLCRGVYFVRQPGGRHLDFEVNYSRTGIYNYLGVNTRVHPVVHNSSGHKKIAVKSSRFVQKGNWQMYHLGADAGDSLEDYVREVIPSCREMDFARHQGYLTRSVPAQFAGCAHRGSITSDEARDVLYPFRCDYASADFGDLQIYGGHVVQDVDLRMLRLGVYLLCTRYGDNYLIFEKWLLPKYKRVDGLKRVYQDDQLVACKYDPLVPTNAVLTIEQEHHNLMQIGRNVLRGRERLQNDNSLRGWFFKNFAEGPAGFPKINHTRAISINCMAACVEHSRNFVSRSKRVSVLELPCC